MNTWTATYNGFGNLHLMTYQTQAKAYRNEMKAGDKILLACLKSANSPYRGMVTHECILGELNLDHSRSGVTVLGLVGTHPVVPYKTPGKPYAPITRTPTRLKK
jgi:hypothetical protein